MKQFKIYTRQDILSLTQVRKFETKLGERILSLGGGALEEELQQSPAKFIVFGIPEDIGIRANLGVGGADSAWTPFLSAFLNTQSNDFLTGEEILLLGAFDFGDLKFLIEQNASDETEKIEAYRHAVVTIDEEVEKLAKIITAAGKIPIAIGGGHNNSYPLIKGCSKGLYKRGLIPIAQINCINLDAHADFRPAEGRHSGNGFRYAEEDGFLQKYCIIGLHEAYLPQNIWLDIVNNPFIDFISYEDIFIHERKSFMQAMAHATAYTEDNFTGVEIDLDAIENSLSSACTPSGISVLQARQFATFTATDANVAYFHICEGAAQLQNGQKQASTGKLISYILIDFLKASLQD